MPFEDPSELGLTITGYFKYSGKITGSPFLYSLYLAVLIP